LVTPSGTISTWKVRVAVCLEPASKQTATRTFQVEIVPDGVTKEIQYTGQRVDLKF